MDDEIRAMVVKAIDARGWTAAEAKQLWIGTMSEARQSPKLRNPVASWTDHYRGLVEATAIECLARVGIDARVLSQGRVTVKGFEFHCSP